MKLPSLIKGWLSSKNIVNEQPEKLLAMYLATSDSKYLNSLVAYYNDALYHYILSQSDRELAEDVLQITWLKVIKSADKFQNTGSVKSWLFSIARNTLIDELRRKNKWDWSSIDDLTSNVSIEKSLIEQDRLTIFNQAIDNLPFYQREAFIFQQEGFSLDEISLLTNESFETVKSRVRYAKKRIKKYLELINER